MSLGKQIVQQRKKANLSQEQLAEQLGVTRQTISKWELEETAPDIKQAEEMSKFFHISLDELVENEVKDVMMERVSNTQKLAGMLIKILRFIGIAILVLLVIDVISFVLFTTVRKETKTSHIKSAELSCSILEKDYLITIGSDGYFNCSNCNKKMQVDLNDITDFADLDHSIENMKTYFKENDGTCD